MICLLSLNAYSITMISILCSEISFTLSSPSSQQANIVNVSHFFISEMFLTTTILLYMVTQQLRLKTLMYQPQQHLRAAVTMQASHLVSVRANDEHRCLRCMTRYRTKPEVETRVFVAKTYVPQQQVDGTVRQEKLHTTTTSLQPFGSFKK